MLDAAIRKTVPRVEQDWSAASPLRGRYRFGHPPDDSSRLDT